MRVALYRNIDGVETMVNTIVADQAYLDALTGYDRIEILPDAPPDPPQVPESVSRFQAMAALHLAGLLQTVEELMDDPETEPLARLAWKNALEFKRMSPTVLALSGPLGLTDEDLDQLFVAAATITA